MLFLPLILFVSSLQSSTEFNEIHRQLTTITRNPLAELKTLEDKISLYSGSLSFTEREQLIDELQTLKKDLCKRPGAGLLALPLLTTAFFGVKSWWHYQEARAIQDSVTQQLLYGGKAARDYVDNFMYFLMGCFANVFIQSEYRDSVAALFGKERAIERTIERLIALLK